MLRLVAIQPDGKIVLAGEMWPPFAALARVNPDGSLDPSFGQGGFVVDRRLPVLKSIALQPDGRILAGAVEGFRLAPLPARRRPRSELRRRRHRRDTRP